VQEVFGADAFGEIQRHRDPDQERQNRALLATGIAPLATGDVRHALPGGKRLLDALTCLRHKTELDRAGRLLLPNAERYLLPARGARQLAAHCRAL
jgi:error-prone DNA polymerase